MLDGEWEAPLHLAHIPLLYQSSTPRDPPIQRPTMDPRPLSLPTSLASLHLSNPLCIIRKHENKFVSRTDLSRQGETLLPLAVPRNDWI